MRVLFAVFVTLGLIAPTARCMPGLAVLVAEVVVAVLMAMVHLALVTLRFLYLILFTIDVLSSALINALLLLFTTL